MSDSSVYSWSLTKVLELQVALLLSHWKSVCVSALHRNLRSPLIFSFSTYLWLRICICYASGTVLGTKKWKINNSQYLASKSSRRERLKNRSSCHHENGKERDHQGAVRAQRRQFLKRRTPILRVKLEKFLKLMVLANTRSLSRVMWHRSEKEDPLVGYRVGAGGRTVAKGKEETESMAVRGEGSG